MTLDVLGLLAACSYALDCVEAELVHVTNNHSKRVAYMSVCIAKQMGIQEESLQDLAVCALLHDNALTQYIQEELHNDISQIAVTQEVPKLGAHCIWGEKNVAELPFHTDVSDVILYHHENADGSGPFGKKWDEIPLFSRIIHLCDLLPRSLLFCLSEGSRFLCSCSFLRRCRGARRLCFLFAPKGRKHRHSEHRKTLC